VRTWWPFIVTGLATGSLYGVAAMGLVLTYKTTGIINFAHGAVAAAAAYVFYEFHVKRGLGWPVAALLCVAIVGVLGGIVMERIARGLAQAPPAAKIVATVGLLLMVQGTTTAIYGAPNIPLAQFLPQNVYRIGGVNVGADQLITFILAAAAAAGLYTFFRFSRAGVAMRGVVDNPTLLDLTGTSPTKVRTQAWMIGNAFAALAGILLAPLLGLEATLLTLLVVQAFGAAAVAAFTSLPLAYLGGLVVGVSAALSTRMVAGTPSLGGLPPSLPFIVLFIVLVFTPKGRFLETPRHRRPAEGATTASSATWSGRVVLAALLLAIPHLVGARLPVYSNGLIFVVVFLSLRLLVRTSGQVSLCQAAFAATGAATFSHLTTGAGLPWVLALLGAGLATVPIGALVAIPAIRLSGVYLALATFGFGLFLERLVYPTGFLFGVAGSRPAPRPSLPGLDLTSDFRFYYVCLAVVALACVTTLVINRSRLGRLLQAMSDSPVALNVHGAAVNVTRVLVFCISAFLAGIAGALFAAMSGAINGVGFGAFASITWLTVLGLVGRGEVSGPFLAAGILAVVPAYASSDAYIKLQPVLFGALALAAALGQGGSFDVRGALSRAAARTAERRRFSPARERRALDGSLAVAGTPPSGGQT